MHRRQIRFRRRSAIGSRLELLSTSTLPPICSVALFLFLWLPFFLPLYSHSSSCGCGLWCGLNRHGTHSGRWCRMKQRCALPGCETVAQNRGLCTKHGARGMCSVSGCTNAGQAKSKCKKHGAKKLCSFSKCPTVARDRGLCFKHGAFKLCSVEGCQSATKVRVRLVYCVACVCKKRLSLLVESKIRFQHQLLVK